MDFETILLLLMNLGAYWGIPLHYYDQFNTYNKETNGTD